MKESRFHYNWDRTHPSYVPNESDFDSDSDSDSNSASDSEEEYKKQEELPKLRTTTHRHFIASSDQSSNQGKQEEDQMEFIQTSSAEKVLGKQKKLRDDDLDQ